MSIWHLLLLFTQASYGLSQAMAYSVHEERQTSSSALYHHRAFHQVIVVGDYLYIDGGEVATWNGVGDGIQGGNNSDVVMLPDNQTYSIDISSSWTNASVTLTAIDKAGVPVVNGFALWPDDSGETFYAYDGGISHVLPSRELPDPPVNQLWQFTPDGASGKWANVPWQPGSNFTDLIRLELGAYTSGKDLGFALGGYDSYRTTTAIKNGWIPTPGLVIYNTTSQTWLNVSTDGYLDDQVSNNAAAWFVPSFGPTGLLAILGGIMANGEDVALDYVYFYEMTTQTWHYQKTSGSSPNPSEVACAVGAQGDNGTYEIFYYGGLTEDIETTISNNVVHVLSLPSFQWQKETYTPTTGRLHHHCTVAGSRQMVVVGGVVKTTYSESVSPGNSITDPWAQGIGVFDMSDFQWKDSYDPNAAQYVTPDIVKRDIEQYGQYPSTWDDSVLEGWFKQAAPTQSPNATSSSSTSSASSTSPASTQSPSSSHHHSDAGAIAGGVVGGLAALALLAAAAFFYRRHRSHHQLGQDDYLVKHNPPDYGTEMQAPHEKLSTTPAYGNEMDAPHSTWNTSGKSPSAEMSGDSYTRSELQDTRHQHDLDSRPVYEMGGHS